MTPTKLELKDAVKKLWERGLLIYKLDSNQQDFYDIVKESPHKTFVFASSRRIGKCLPEWTDILTPEGPKQIKDIRPGDTVYGYNKDGTVTETFVVGVEYQGEKEVVDLLHNKKIVATSTKEHRWLTRHVGTQSNQGEIERTPDQFYKGIQIVKAQVKIPGGIKDVRDAYVIGALLGDGCSRQGTEYQLHISSEDSAVPRHIAKILKLPFKRQNLNNYTWTIGHFKNNNKVRVSFYNDWCLGKYAHEKFIDINEIKTWNRKSRLKLLAGLLDTDGSIGVHNNILNISFWSQSKSLIEAVQYLIYSLIQWKPGISKESRDKYKNGPMYYMHFRNNKYSKILLKELTKYLQKNKKKWKPEYAYLPENNSSKKALGVLKGNTYTAKCWDIQVANETNLYLTGNGLVTHNSYTLCVLAIEECLKKPYAVVKYLAPQQKMVRTILKPLMREILGDCPKELMPKYHLNEGVWRFPNGSEIQMAGVDSGNAENLRGGSANLCVIDEAGFVGELKYTINSILLPTTTTTNGKIILASTPPPNNDHEFVEYAVKAEARGAFLKKTIYDCPRVSNATIEQYAEELGGKDTVAFRREYLADFITDTTRAVIPEMTRELEQEIVKEVERPPFYDNYVSMDIGFKDLTAILFAHLDFRKGVLVIEDEFTINGEGFTTDKLAESIRKKEYDLWYNQITGEVRPPFMRISDNNLLVLNDLHKLHDLLFIPTAKDDKDSALNELRMKLAQKRIIIHPRCKQLLFHLRNAVWTKSKKTYDRSADGGHFDLVDALVYLVRNVNWTKNPYPANYDAPKTDLSKPYVGQKSGVSSWLEGLFTVKSSINKFNK